MQLGIRAVVCIVCVKAGTVQRALTHTMHANAHAPFCTAHSVLGLTRCTEQLAHSFLCAVQLGIRAGVCIVCVKADRKSVV